MKDCLQCTKPLVHVPGRKEKSFCDVNCRNKYFYAKRKKEIEDAKALLISLPADYINVKKVGVLTADGQVKPLNLKKNNKPSKAKQSDAAKAPKGASQVDISPHPAKPKNLDELKKLCPPDLTGLDRSNWVATERQKYGI